MTDLRFAQGAMSGSKKWYAIYVRSRFEKKVNLGLKLRKVESFLPLIEEVRFWTDRKKRTQIPLFPGYLFVRIDIRDKLEVLKVDGIVRFVGTSNRASLVPEEQINWVKILAGHPETLAHESAHPIDEEVKVIAGPFQGIRGVVKRLRGKTRVVVTVESIGKSLSVEVAPEYLEHVKKEEKEG